MKKIKKEVILKPSTGDQPVVVESTSLPYASRRSGFRITPKNPRLR